MLEAIYERIEERLDALGLKAAPAATMAGLSSSAIRNIKRAVESGKGGVTINTLERLAPVLGVTPAWLIGGDEAPMVPLVSSVSATNLRHEEGVTADTIKRWLAVGDLPSSGEWIALTVEGSSMDMVAPDGATILVNRADSALVRGRLYVFALGSGEATFKQWQPDPDRLQPLSNDRTLPSIPVHDRDDLYVVGRVRRVIIDF